MESRVKTLESKLHLYEDIAGRVARLIEQGTFRPGARLPSIRQLSQQWTVSITTVLGAYRLLENEGLIEARPQSGYYVQPPVADHPVRLDSSRPAGAPTEVGVGDLLMMVVRDTRRPELAQLGAACPDPALLPVERLNRALAAAARDHGVTATCYDVPPGCEALRVQIARRGLTAGCTLAPHEIVVTSGCQEALLLSLRALCRPGDMVAVESPTFYGVFQALEMLGLQALEIPTHPREGISLEALHYALDLQPVRACLVISNFNNPLGSCMPEEKKRDLVHLLTEHGVPLIEDDIYGDLAFSAERPKVAKAFDDAGTVLLCSSFSKTLASGYRVGWVAPGRFQPLVERLKLVSNIATASLPQLAIAAFLAAGGYDHHLRRIRRLYARHVELMEQAVTRSFPEGTTVTRPTGGFVLWVEMPPSIDSVRLYERALAEGITFAPGPLFSSKPKYRNCLRLNAANWSDRIEEAVVRLGALAAAEMQ